MLFLDPFSDNLRPGETFCFTALVQLFQRFLVQTDAEHEVLGTVGQLCAFVYAQTVHLFSLWAQTYCIVATEKSQEVFRKKFRCCPGGQPPKPPFERRCPSSQTGAEDCILRSKIYEVNKVFANFDYFVCSASPNAILSQPAADSPFQKGPFAPAGDEGF